MTALPVDPQLYAVYLGAMAVMAATPGPANVFAIATGIERGARAGLVGVAGLNAATLVWFAGAALGLGALMAAFPQVFVLLTYAGAAWVAWLGIKALRAGLAGGGTDVSRAAAARPGLAFRDGFAVQIANPKAVVFFSAVLPPFLDAGRDLLPQLVMFAAATIVLDVAFMSAYALAGGALARRFEDLRFRRGFSVAVGLLLLTAAGLILLARHS